MLDEAVDDLAPHAFRIFLIAVLRHILFARCAHHRVEMEVLVPQPDLAAQRARTPLRHLLVTAVHLEALDVVLGLLAPELDLRRAGALHPRVVRRVLRHRRLERELRLRALVAQVREVRKQALMHFAVADLDVGASQLHIILAEGPRTLR